MSYRSHQYDSIFIANNTIAYFLALMHWLHSDAKEMILALGFDDLVSVTASKSSSASYTGKLFPINTTF